MNQIHLSLTLTLGQLGLLPLVLKKGEEKWQQGVSVKGVNKSAPVNEDVPTFLEGSGKIEVWRINGSAKTPVAKEDVGKFYSGDCYILFCIPTTLVRRRKTFTCAGGWERTTLSLEVLLRMLKKGPRIQSFGLHWERNKLTQAKSPLRNLSGTHTCSLFLLQKGNFQIEEIYNITQDDLLTEDMKYIEMAASLEGLSLHIPLYRITEGNEPCFFTTYFSWDPAKANV